MDHRTNRRRYETQLEAAQHLGATMSIRLARSSGVEQSSGRRSKRLTIRRRRSTFGLGLRWALQVGRESSRCVRESSSPGDGIRGVPESRRLSACRNWILSLRPADLAPRSNCPDMCRAWFDDIELSTSPTAFSGSASVNRSSSATCSDAAWTPHGSGPVRDRPARRRSVHLARGVRGTRGGT